MTSFVQEKYIRVLLGTSNLITIYVPTTQLPFRRTMNINWKKEYFNFNCIYLLMGCMCLLITAQLLKPWNQIENCHSHFLSHNNWQWHLLCKTVITKNSASRRYYLIKRDIGRSNVETMNHPREVVCVSLCFPWTFKICCSTSVSCLQCPRHFGAFCEQWI